MSYINTKALVLAKSPLTEADRLYVLYTPEHGKIEARVKSAASSASKLAGSLEPVCLVQALIAKGKRWESLAGVQLIRRFNVSGQSAYGLSGLVREVFIKMVKPGAGEPQLFGKLLNYFLAVEKNQRHWPTCRFLTLRFIWQFLNFSGFSRVGRPTGFFANSVAGGLGRDLTGLLQSCLAPEVSGSLQVSHNLLQKLERFTYNYLRHVLEQDLNYLSFAR